MALPEKCDVAMVGGGFFGCILACRLATRGLNVVLFEREPELLTRASYANQARVHNGYHYPRHFMTAVRSRANFERFVDDFGPSIVNNFEKYYAVGTRFSKVSAKGFEGFARRMGAPIQRAPDSVLRLFNQELIEAVYRVEEYAFDAVKLRELALARLVKSGAQISLETSVTRLERTSSGSIRVSFERNGDKASLLAARVFNCTYSNINTLLSGSGLPPIALKHEITEMCLIDVPPELSGKAVTVVCGPFFSFMPFPPRNLYTLSHVRYTPHCYFHDDASQAVSPYEVFRSYPRRTSYPAMIRDVVRYLPCMAEAVYRDSIWEVKTILPASENNDGRPILFRSNHGVDGLTCIMGGKLDNIYDAEVEIERDLEDSQRCSSPIASFLS